MVTETTEKNPTDSLETLRKRLLDLSARNRLLNFRHTKNSSLRVVDELPDQLIKTLLADTEMAFRAVPEPTKEELLKAGYIEIEEETGAEKRIKKDPTAEEWAQLLGYDTSYEVPESDKDDNEEKHHDNEIQTLFYPNELETRLRGLRSKAKTAIEETGSNILFLVLGFLEWHDRDKNYLAPLFLFPVQLEKGAMKASSKTYEYRISYSGEDILPNLSLREKLAVDFNVALPDLDENTTPEEYFDLVSEVLFEEKPNWKVYRKVTLTLLNFSKLLMYLDLDPSRWPAEGSILDHSIVKKFLSGYNEDSNVQDVPFNAGFSEEYEIDEVKNIHQQYPLIEDADSSQHSALIDVVNGKNLVIEGPPGTGKSQTITNLIAALLSQNKRVLFVAEKLAALEVVKSRLDRANLGEFCLELHSHKTQKRKLIDDLSYRIGEYGYHRAPSEIGADIERYEDLKSKLKDYVECVNKTYRKTGQTIHQILMKATRFRKKISVSPELLHPKNITGDIFDASVRREVRDQVMIFAEGYSASAIDADSSNDMRSHPWFGVRNTYIQIFDIDQIRSSLSDWRDSLKAICQFQDKLNKSLPSINNSKSLPDVEDLLNDLLQVPEVTGQEIFEALPGLKAESIPKAKQYLAFHAGIQDLYSQLASNIDAELLKDLSFVVPIQEALITLESLISAPEGVSPAEIIERLEKLAEEIDDVNVVKEEIIRQVPSDLESMFDFNSEGIEELKFFILKVAELKPGYWKFRDELFDNDEIDESLPELSEDLSIAHRLKGELQENFRIEQLPDKEALLGLKHALLSAGFFKIFNNRWKAAKRELCGYSLNPNVKIKTLVPHLDDLIQYAETRDRILNNSEYKALFKDHFDGLYTDVEKLTEIRMWYRDVRKHYGLGFGPKVMLGDSVLDLPASVARSVRALSESGYFSKLDSVSEHLNILTPVLQNLCSKSESFQLNSTIVKDSLEQLKSALADCSPLTAGKEISIPDVVKQINDLQELQKRTEQWEKSAHDRILFKGQLGLEIGVEADNTVKRDVADRTLALAEVLNVQLGNSTVSTTLLACPELDTFHKLFSVRDELKKLCSQQDSAFLVYQQKVKLDYDDWTASIGSTILDVIAKCERALGNENALWTYLDYVRTRGYLAKIGYSSLADVVEQSCLPPESIVDGFWAGTYDLLSREILREYPYLARFSGLNQDALRRQFSEYDEKLKLLQREAIAARVDGVSVPAGNGGGRVSQYTDLFLLKHECNKKNRHIPIRQLVKRAGDALLALKPCFMMGPMSVAQYLEPGRFKFDVVIMDEASQIKPEDALGTIGRGKNLVVVGDPKQLPPTNFFNRLVQDEEDDPTGLEESESILSATLPIFTSRCLRWHYRSQHESLIAFSNHTFYNDNLIVFPSPNSESELFGINFHRLKRGCFSGRRNNREAEAIADKLKAHFINNPDESVGVVSMSSEQRDQIERAIEQASKEDPLFRQLIERDAQKIESLFLKNLENVQGDERDVIMISMTYGPADVGGKVYQRFGPINSDVGWRRLNVLFTRSRKRMHIFSSMSSSDIVVSSGSSLGVRALRDFLAYCESGKLSQMISEGNRAPDSDFEIAVMEALGSYGFECVPQVGVAGFFIDIAVRDPGNPGSYLMGVECDGATYHSAKSVRDRDRLRQTVLERLGWNIRRIWSTDWFKNPDSQILPIIEELNSLKTEPQSLKKLVEDVVEVKNEVTDSLEVNESISSHPVHAVSAEEALQEQIFEAVDKLASEEIGLREKLICYDVEVIQKELDGVPENRRLLRPAMLDTLVNLMPTSKSEFLEMVPRYLREETAPGQGEYLSGVIDIISAEVK